MNRLGRPLTEQARRHRPDYLLLILASMLLVIGLVVMYAISPALQAPAGANPISYYVGRQAIAIVIGLIAFAGVALVPFERWRKIMRPLSYISLGACLLTILLDGLANRWIQIGGFSFQPAEMVKFSLIIALAAFLVDRIGGGELGDVKKTLKPIMVALGVVGLVVVVLQRDLGSMLVLLAIAGVMIFLAGVPLGRVVTLGILVCGLVLLAILATPYRRDRLLTFMQPERDCQNAGYHACQALIAVGSGGVLGLGLGNSVQAWGYLPEAANDSIFAIYAEKFGFVGVLVLFALLTALLFRLLRIIERSTEAYTRLVVGGVFAWLAVQSIINIGAMIGLLPLKGITLPLISYGGSSIIFVMAALGLAFRASAYTQFRKIVGITQDREASHGNLAYGRGIRRSYNAGIVRR